MGMDIFGQKPSDEVGEYFRNNVWWWHPLAEFVVSTYPELTEACTYWNTNDGDGLDAAGALALAQAIDDDIDSGKVAAYANEYDARLAALPRVECWLCKGAGIRTDEVGVASGLDRPRDPVTGVGGCNGCEGAGTTAHHLTHYPFSVENVTEFSAFLRESGGFQIW